MKVITTFLLTLLLQASFAQIADNTSKRNDRNIYYQTLKQYFNFRATDSYYSKLNKIDTIYISRDKNITDSLLNIVETTKIIMIDEPYTFIKKRKVKGIVLYTIFPLEFENGEFSVSFVPFGVSIDKKYKRGLRFSNPGSYKVVFKFENKQFQFIRVEDHGI